MGAITPEIRLDVKIWNAPLARKRINQLKAQNNQKRMHMELLGADVECGRAEYDET